MSRTGAMPALCARLPQGGLVRRDADGPVSLGWQGALRVEAGGHLFTETVAEDGKVSFSAG